MPRSQEPSFPGSRPNGPDFGHLPKVVMGIFRNAAKISGAAPELPESALSDTIPKIDFSPDQAPIAPPAAPIAPEPEAAPQPQPQPSPEPQPSQKQEQEPAAEPEEQPKPYAEKLETFINLVHEKGFSPGIIRTINSIEARLGEAKKTTLEHTAINGVPLAEFEAATDDAQTDVLLREGLKKDLDSKLNDEIGLVKLTEGSGYKESKTGVPHLGDWLEREDLKNAPKELKDAVLLHYGGWLLWQKSKVIEKLDQDVSKHPIASDKGGSKKVVSDATEALKEAVDQDINDLFIAHLERGIQKLEDPEFEGPATSAEPEPRKRALGRIGLGKRRDAKSANTLSDQTGEERKLLTDFFGVEQALTHSSRQPQDFKNVAAVIDQLRDDTDLTGMEASARTYLTNELVTAETATAVLDAYKAAHPEDFERKVPGNVRQFEGWERSPEELPNTPPPPNQAPPAN